MNEEKFKQDITEIVDILIQIDSLRELMTEKKKEIKTEHELPVATITKIATLIRKQNLAQEDEKWQEIKDLVEKCK